MLSLLATYVLVCCRHVLVCWQGIQYKKYARIGSTLPVVFVLSIYSSIIRCLVAIYVVEVVTCNVWGNLKQSCVLSGVIKFWEMNLLLYGIPGSWKYWTERKLAVPTPVGTRVNIANTLVDLNWTVQYRTAILIIYMCASNKFWLLQRRTTKLPDLISCQIFQLWW